MYMHTYGTRSSSAAILLHPMGITAEKVYEIIGSRLSGSRYLLIPDMGNHGKEPSEFISAENEAENLAAYLKDNGITEISLLYGASMGAAVALQLLSRTDIPVRSMYLDGAPVAKLGPIMTRVFAPVLIWQRGIYAKNDRKKLAEFIERWGEDLNDHMRENFIRFSDNSIRNIAKACVQGNMVTIPEELQKHTVMEWGSSEEYAKKSPGIVKRLYPLVHVEVRQGYNHCEYMMKKNAEYVAAIESCGDGAESGGQVR